MASILTASFPDSSSQERSGCHGRSGVEGIKSRIQTRARGSGRYRRIIMLVTSVIETDSCFNFEEDDDLFLSLEMHGAKDCWPSCLCQQIRRFCLDSLHMRIEERLMC